MAIGKKIDKKKPQDLTRLVQMAQLVAAFFTISFVLTRLFVINIQFVGLAGLLGVTTTSTTTTVTIASTTTGYTTVQSTTTVSAATTTIIPSNTAFIDTVVEQVYYSSTSAGYKLLGTTLLGGLNVTSGKSFMYTLNFSNPQTNRYPYRIDYIQSGTDDFSVNSVNQTLPMIVLPGANASANITVLTPIKSYKGNLTIKTYETQQPPIPPTKWDERIGLSFAKNITNFTYIVTAVVQNDSYGCGPSSSIDGLTPQGYMYEIGIAYNWCNMSGTGYAGFVVVYNLFGPTGQRVVPATGGDGIIRFKNGYVSAGDPIQLSISFAKSGINLAAKDLTSKATISNTLLNAYGGTYFVGTGNAYNSNGYFTGLMTEWHHINAYYGTEQKVTFTPVCQGACAQIQSVPWINEFYTVIGNLTFSSSSNVLLNSMPQNVTVSANNVYGTYFVNGTFATG